MAEQIQTYLREQMPVWKSRYPGVENMTVAVMGCVVNGPGESKMANVGISLPGTGEIPVAPVYVDGQKTVTLKGDRITVNGFAQSNARVSTFMRNLESSPYLEKPSLVEIHAITDKTLRHAEEMVKVKAKVEV